MKLGHGMDEYEYNRNSYTKHTGEQGGLVGAL